MQPASHLYLIALGSNRRHPLFGQPTRVLEHAVEALELPDIDVFAVSQIMVSKPVGPSAREYANAAALVLSKLSPPELLAQLKAIEAHFGRRDIGQRWRGRILDLDIVLWDGGCWADECVTVPHPHFRERGFVLTPAAQIAPKMRDPVSGLTMKQLTFRFLHPKRVDPRRQPA